MKLLSVLKMKCLITVWERNCILYHYYFTLLLLFSSPLSFLVSFSHSILSFAFPCFASSNFLLPQLPLTHHTLHLFLLAACCFFSLSRFCLTTLLPLSDPALHSPHSPSGPVEQSCWRTRLNRIEHGCMLLCEISQSSVCTSSLICSELLCCSLS